ncbi:hypothetical protein N658DRAFT_506128 [Parathielavia hyrcaniae]|uniref:Uncharacterized protein n=1 Tax=Parathielavia hyrcaniae TaxID=113614 RepID=A0AAN6T3A9_9PEZI|nr:hypothetical protein N658DRAFT_506128 [Parathielavia hyrcaniae]
MASEASTDPGAINLNLTPEEKRVYGQLFRYADTDNVGVVTGEVAVKFFEKTRLDSRVLGEIWQIADKENRGFLTPAGFGIVLRLIGHAQAGREPSTEIALQTGPLPKFDGFTPTPAPPPPQPALQAQGTGAPAPIRIPPLTPEKVAQYSGLFERQTLQNGNMLPGEEAKKIFEKSGLPNDVLGRIWMLADTEQRGALVLTEFVIAMHLLTSIKTGALRGLPTILPAALYEAATRRAPGGVGIPRQQSPTTPTHPIPAVPRQLTGQGALPQMRTGSPLGRPPMVAQTTGDWLVTPADKARFDQLYDELDKTKRGFITGEEAVPFFSQSNLSEDVLAQIWDLADIKSEGRLTKDEFAVAMYLIRQQRTKSAPLAATLPPNLIPPAMRAQLPRPPAVTSASVPSAFEPPPRPQPPQPKPSALDDLFGLDDIQPPAPAQVPVGTGGSAGGDPFATSISPAAPSSPARPSPSTSTFKPFVPSSSFGRGLTSQVTGGSTNSATVKPVAVDDDLLGDAEPEVTKKLNSETTELANLSNQIGSLTKQVQDVQGQRTATQNELSQSSTQKKNFEQRLAQLRAMYEKEAQDVRSLETQLNASRNETKKLQTEYAMVDATYQELQNQHRQVVAALLADQQENVNLKEKIRTVNAEVAQLKPQIEKLKSEARQQKGLVAINKKQLATNEGERDRLKVEAEDLTRSNEELARQISASSSPTPAQVASPALSAASANNPFFRRTGSTDITSTFSPPMRAFTDKAFDDVFGPGPAGSQAGTPPPPPAAAAVFRQNTGASTGSVGSFATPASTSPNASRDVAAPAETGRSTPAFPQFVDAPESLSTSRQVSPPLSRTETNQEGVAAPLEPAQTGQSLASGSGSDARAASPASAAETKPAFGSISEGSKKGPEADPFAVADQDKAKEDFESAFASFKQARATTGSNADTSKAFTNFSTQFPPISELERDEESDTESERGGFDDDFAPASPPSKMAEKGAESRSASPVVSKATPDVGGAATLAASPEPAAASDKPAAATTTATTNSFNNLSSSNVDDIFGPPGAAASSTAPTASKGAFDDLDDDFEGLEDAKEGSADDDFATISRSGFDDFNPMFDSSPPPSQHKSDSAHTAAAFGTESSFDFASLSGASVAGSSHGGPAAGATGSAPAAAAVSTPAGGAQPQQAGGSAKPAAASQTQMAAVESQQDWDALFAGLDDAAATPTASSHILATGGGGSNGEIGAAAGAATGSGTAEASGSLAPGGSGGGGSSSRPIAPGRALTEEGEHDDPILKNLTGMGYSRPAALAALEKYDYNLERVSYANPSGGGMNIATASTESGDDERVGAGRGKRVRA